MLCILPAFDVSCRGRHEELRRTIRILGRRTKNNPVLVGEARMSVFLSLSFSLSPFLPLPPWLAGCLPVSI